MKRRRRTSTGYNGKPHLVSARWLGNNGVRVIYRGPTGTDSVRFEPPAGLLTLPEAVKLLHTYEVMLYRLRDMKRLAFRRRGRAVLITVRECLRIRRLWRRMGRRTVRIPGPAARRKQPAGGAPRRRREDRKLPAPLKLKTGS